MKRRSRFYFAAHKFKVGRLPPVIHLLCSGAQLHGVGNPASSFLSGDVDHVFKSQRDLGERGKVKGAALSLGHFALYLCAAKHLAVETEPALRQVEASLEEDVPLEGTRVVCQGGQLDLRP